MGLALLALPASAQATQTLTVEKPGTGTGTLKSSPAGIDCGATCKASFPDNTLVTLTATPGPNTQAPTWSGCDAVNGEGRCEVTMSSAREVKATFNLIQRELKVKKEGTGTGTVKSSPAGIDCGGVCTAGFDLNSTVTLTATPGPNTLPVSWSGCGGVNAKGECLVQMSAAREVKAVFELGKRELKLLKKGPGQGTVTSSPAGISCGATCAFVFNEGTTVTLTGTPEGPAEAPLWTGCDSVNGEGKCVVAMNAAREVSAAFPAPAFPLALIAFGNGAGTVTSSPSGIECTSTCTAEFVQDSTAILKGVPGLHTEAVKWSGCDALNKANECEVTMSGAREVTANFSLEPQYVEYNVSVVVKGTGTGSVQSFPPGISCPGDCSQKYIFKTPVTLIATAGSGAEFSHWAGGSCSGTGPCERKINSDRLVNAVFNAVGNRTLSVSKAGSGQGVVTSKPAAIECGATCSAELDAATKVALHATATPGSTFTGFSGEGCAGTAPCKVTMNEARNVSATFATNSTPPVTHHPRHCRKGFKKRRVKGKVRCVRVKHHHHHHGRTR